MNGLESATSFIGVLRRYQAETDNLKFIRRKDSRGGVATNKQIMITIETNTRLFMGSSFCYIIAKLN